MWDASGAGTREDEPDLLFREIPVMKDHIGMFRGLNIQWDFIKSEIAFGSYQIVFPGERSPVFGFQLVLNALIMSFHSSRNLSCSLAPSYLAALYSSAILRRSFPLF